MAGEQLSDVDKYQINKAVKTAAHYANQYPSGVVNPPPVDGLQISVTYQGGKVSTVKLTDAPNHGIQQEIK